MKRWFWVTRNKDSEVVWLHSLEPTPYYYQTEVVSWESDGRQMGFPSYEFADIKPGECVRFKLIRDDEEGGEGE